MFDGTVIQGRIFRLEVDDLAYTVTFGPGLIDSSITDLSIPLQLRHDRMSTCPHRYASREIGRCLTEYTCSICMKRKVIDSGD